MMFHLRLKFWKEKFVGIFSNWDLMILDQFRSRRKSDVATFCRPFRSGTISLATIGMSRRWHSMRSEERVGTHSCGSCGAGGTRETCASASWLHGTKTSPLNDVTVSPMKPVLPRYFSIPNCNCRLDINI